MNAISRRFDDFLLALAAVAVASLAIGAFAFTRTTTREVGRELPYSQTGALSYTAEVRDPGLYDTGVAHAGDPVFARLSDAVRFEYSYRLSMASAHSASGTTSLNAELGEASGWKRTLPLSPEQAFSGDEVLFAGSLSLTDLRQLADKFTEATGIARPQFTLTLRPVVTLTGVVGAEPLALRFKPSAAFVYDEAGLRPAPTGTKEGDPFVAHEESFATSTVPAARLVSVLALHTTIAQLRSLAIAGLVFSALAGVVLALVHGRRREEPEGLADALARYGDAIVVAAEAAPLAAGAVHLSSLEGLVRVARTEGTVVIAYPLGPGAQYFVRGVVSTYRYAPRRAEASPAAVRA